MSDEHLKEIHNNDFVDYKNNPVTNTDGFVIAEPYIKSQEARDPIIEYLIVKTSLNMSTGKIAAQCAHAAQLLEKRYASLCNEVDSYIDIIYKTGSEQIPKVLLDKIHLYESWNNSGVPKVVLRANDKEFEKIKTEYEDSLVLIQDAGRTEIPAGSETVIGLFPQYKSKVTSTLKRLQLL